MQITITSTDKIVELNGVPARLWEGHTSSGIPVHCFVTRIAVPLDADHAQFERELQECRPPINADVRGIPLRLVL